MSYTVESIVSQEQKPKKAGGVFTKYLLQLKDEGQVGFADFQGVNPQPGQSLDGYEIRDDGFGPELKKAGSPSRPSSNGRKALAKDFKADPAKLRSENARSALHCAKDLVVAEKISLDKLGEWTGKFYDFVESKAKVDG